jgi:hypothetical protein
LLCLNERQAAAGNAELKTSQTASDGSWFAFCVFAACVGYMVVGGVVGFRDYGGWTPTISLAAVFVAAGFALGRGRPGFSSGWICGTLLGVALLLGGLFWLAVTIGS